MDVKARAAIAAGWLGGILPMRVRDVGTATVAPDRLPHDGGDMVRPDDRLARMGDDRHHSGLRPDRASSMRIGGAER